MLNEQENIDKLFHTILSEHEEDVPAFVWENIENELDRKKKRRVIVILRSVAAGLALFISFGIGLLLSKQQFDTNKSNTYAKTTKQADKQLNINNLQQDSVFFHANDVQLANTSDKDKNTKNKTQNTNQNRKNINGKQLKKTGSPKRKFLQKNKVKPTLLTDNSEQKTEKRKTEISKITALHGQIFATIESATLQIPEDYSPQNTGIAIADFDKKNLSNEEILQIQDSLYQQLIKNSENKSVKNNNRQWAVGGELSPSLNYSAQLDFRKLNYDSNSGSSLGIADISIVDKKNTLNSFAGGFNVQYFKSKKVSLISGLYFVRLGQTAFFFPNEMASETMDLHTNFGNIRTRTDKTVAGETNSLLQEFDYIEMPLIGKFKILDKKLSVSLLAGINMRFLVQNKAFIQNSNTPTYIGKTEAIRRINYGGNFGFGIEYTVKQRFIFNFSPSLKFPFQSLNYGSEPNYPFSIAFTTGISYLLGN